MERLKPGWMVVGLWFAMMSGGHAQSPPTAKPEFDVASVRQNKSDDKPSSTLSLDNGNVYSTVNKGDVFTPRGTYFAATNQPLWHYISFAYNLSGTQELALRFSYFADLSSKAPSWVTGGFDSSADRFDIKARSDGRPTKDQMRLMMQTLLADRFKLMVHHETRQAPVFALCCRIRVRWDPPLYRIRRVTRVLSNPRMMAVRIARRTCRCQDQYSRSYRKFAG